MRYSLVALALAAASFSVTATGHAGASYAEGYSDHRQQTCVTERIHAERRDGRTVTKRFRICR